MPIVTVMQSPSDVEVKRKLIKNITAAFVDVLNVPAESVQVWIQEVPSDSWGMAGKLFGD